MNNKEFRGDLISIIIPAKNEGSGLSQILPRLRQLYPHAEIIVVNDGSSDNTLNICGQYTVKIVTHPYCMGNGAAIKSGARVATGDMLVGARRNDSQASLGRSYANRIYNRLASWMVGKKIDDLTSGFRVATATKFREFVYLLPNGFSYPTTITMSFFRAGYPVTYLPIHANNRQGKSHINPLHDGLRFLLIIFKVGTLYSPLKIFLPISLTFFTAGLGYYIYTYLTEHRFTNMSGLLFTTSVLVFLIGLVSEQITSLLYSRGGQN